MYYHPPSANKPFIDFARSAYTYDYKIFWVECVKEKQHHESEDGVLFTLQR